MKGDTKPCQSFSKLSMLQTCKIILNDLGLNRDKNTLQYDGFLYYPKNAPPRRTFSSCKCLKGHFAQRCLTDSS